MRRRALSLLALGLAALLTACPTEVTPPDGVFACEDESACPEDFECRADGYCYAVLVMERDATADGSGDAGDADTDASADAGRDADSSDAAPDTGG